MREIKFRGLSPSKKWVYGYLTTSTHCQTHKRIFVIKHSNIESTQVEEETIGQFTGLKDKNGKEIYEGDIIKKPEELSHKKKLIKTKPYEIEFSSGGFHAKGAFHLSMAVKDYEVIGDIYRNPELLSQKQDKTKEMNK